MVEPSRLAELILARQPCVVLTGAGVSTESGIPDFRSPGGLWSEFDPLDYGSIDVVPPRPGADLGVLRRAGSRSWPRPSRTTRIARSPALEARGLVEAVVTQNIDLLHERAGSRNVVEVHGSIRRAVCLACGADEPLARVLAQLESTARPAVSGVRARC